MATRPLYYHRNGRTCEWDDDDHQRYPVGTDEPCDRMHP